MWLLEVVSDSHSERARVTHHTKGGGITAGIERAEPAFIGDVVDPQRGVPGAVRVFAAQASREIQQAITRDTRVLRVVDSAVGPGPVVEAASHKRLQCVERLPLITTGQVVGDFGRTEYPFAAQVATGRFAATQGHFGRAGCTFEVLIFVVQQGAVEVDAQTFERLELQVAFKARDRMVPAFIKSMANAWVSKRSIKWPFRARRR